MLWLALVLLVAAAGWDLRRREVPDAFSLALLVTAVIGTALGWSDVGWWSLLAGFAIALSMAAIFFYFGGLGGADVKLMAGLGAVLGIEQVFPALFWIALAGGVLSLIALARSKRDFAYVPAIAFGFTFFLLWQEGVTHAIGQ
jgi:prepilin peptidase CpaA